MIAARGAVYTLAVLVGAAALLLAWLRWDANRPRDGWWSARKGALVAVDVEPVPADAAMLATAVRLRSDTGLAVELRALRPSAATEPMPVLVILGGYRTGRDAVELVRGLTDRAVVALDYPYDGSHRLSGLPQILAALPDIRQAFLDMPPALSLALDWLEGEPWVNRDNIALAGVSLGVPFAAAAASRDRRFSSLALIHGGADNRDWLRLNLPRRWDAGPFGGAIATVFNWLAYGPVYDTPAHVGAMSPRPVLIVGARDDRRVPPGAAERLYEAAHEPKALRFTEGMHVGPGRTGIIDQLLRIAEEEL